MSSIFQALLSTITTERKCNWFSDKVEKIMYLEPLDLPLHLKSFPWNVSQVIDLWVFLVKFGRMMQNTIAIFIYPPVEPYQRNCVPSTYKFEDLCLATSDCFVQNVAPFIVDILHSLRVHS